MNPANGGISGGSAADAPTRGVQSNNNAALARAVGTADA